MTAKKEENILPFDFVVSFEKVYEAYKPFAAEKHKNHVYHSVAKQMQEAVKAHPQLLTGFRGEDWINKRQDEVDLMLSPLFPEPLMTNEIKAATIPFSQIHMKRSKRFQNILNAAGNDYEVEMDVDANLMYIYSCVMILAVVYEKYIELKRPFYANIPNAKGHVMNYRVAWNADMVNIIPSKDAPKITDKEFKRLLDSADDISVWKELFPPKSYEFKGFTMINMFDVTTDSSISEIRTNLLKGRADDKEEDRMVEELELSMRKFFNIEDLRIGFNVFDLEDDTKLKKSHSLFLDQNEELPCDQFFCKGIVSNVFEKKEPWSISNTAHYAELTNHNEISKRLIANDIGSIILVPVYNEDISALAVIEIACPRQYELNSINLQKLHDIIPMFEHAVERNFKELQTLIEATIQDQYTAIHPAVKWRFEDAAEQFLMESQENDETAKLQDIVFDNVYPLFGQADIKGSSVARNVAIQEDLTTQLKMAKAVLDAGKQQENLPIYDELSFRIDGLLAKVKGGLNAGDELGILEFLRKDIYPTFNHLKSIHADLSNLIDEYMNRLDPELNVIYEKRRSYEESVTLLNNKLTKYIDKRQEDAQAMYPHYFERYKTDGVEHDMYIGQSLVKNKKYDDLYLYNLRLWQLQLMYEMENLAYNAIPEMKHELRVASMILVHSNSLSIKFRMDEKKFDVDGAYNIRYAIIKKRIDKAHIKGTEDRITVPGKLAIIYSQDKDKLEYLKYIKYLQSKNVFGELEELELEDLQGVSGLKALRVEIIYQSDFDEKSAKAMDELIKEFQK